MFCNRPHSGKIRVELEPALETLHKLAVAQESFDFMLIDSEKNEYAQYLKILLDNNLLVFNGLICVGNKLSQRQVHLPPKAQTQNGETMTCLNRIVKDNPQIEQVLLPIRDGLTIPVASVGNHKSKGRSASPCLLNL